MTHTWNYRLTFKLPTGKLNITIQNAPTYEQAYMQAMRHVWFGTKPQIIKREIKHRYGWENLDTVRI